MSGLLNKGERQAQPGLCSSIHDMSWLRGIFNLSCTRKFVSKVGQSIIIRLHVWQITASNRLCQNECIRNDVLIIIESGIIDLPDALYDANLIHHQ